MVTPKENFLRTLQGRCPDRFVNEWEPFALVMNDAMMKYLRSDRKKGGEWVDRWGTCMQWPDDQPGAMPHITPENKVLKDIHRWREISPPDLRANCTDWADALDSVRQADRNEKMVMCVMLGGIFEQAHYLMGFEDTLCNLLLEPELMHEFLEMLLQYKLTYAELLIENLKPDIILSHDDWGTKTKLFVRPDTWREFFKPLYKTLYGYIRSRGVMVMHHADSFCEPIVEDMAEIGINVWQGCLPENDIPSIQKKLAGRMTLMGGVDASVTDVPGWTEAGVRAETRRACREYATGGFFIPCVTYGGPGTIYPEVDAIVRDEIGRCNLEYSENGTIR